MTQKFTEEFFKELSEKSEIDTKFIRNAYDKAAEILKKIGINEINDYGIYGFGSEVTIKEAETIYDSISEWDENSYLDFENNEIECYKEFEEAGEFGCISISDSICEGDTTFIVSYNEL